MADLFPFVGMFLHLLKSLLPLVFSLETTTTLEVGEFKPSEFSPVASTNTNTIEKFK